MKSYIKGNRRIDVKKADGNIMISCYISGELVATIDYNEENKDLALAVMDII